MSKRLSRVSETIQHQLSAIIKKDTSDPRLNDVTITEVDVSPDLRQAAVYVTTLTTDIDEALKALDKAKGYLRSQVSQHLYLKYLPELNFRKDESIEKAAKIEKLIQKVKKKEEGQDGKS